MTERMPGDSVVTFNVSPTNVPASAVDAAIADVRERYSPWGINVTGGSCPQDNRSFTIYLTPTPAPEQAIVGAGKTGYAYIGGWGLLDPSGTNLGYVFTNLASSQYLGVLITHEAGHGAGLYHPGSPERNIMYDPAPWLGWSDAQSAFLTTKFLTPPPN